MTTPESITSPVTVKRVGMDLRPPSSRASPAVGDMSRHCRPSRRLNILPQPDVRKILAWTRPGRSASLVFGSLPGDLHSRSVSTSWKCRRNCTHAEGYRIGRRQWNEALSDHTRREQTAAANLRQADGLLSAVDLDAGRHSRHSRYHHANGSLSVRTVARRWQAMGDSSHLCGAAQTRRARRSLHYWSGFHWT